MSTFSTLILYVVEYFDDALKSIYFQIVYSVHAHFPFRLNPNMSYDIICDILCSFTYTETLWLIFLVSFICVAKNILPKMNIKKLFYFYVQ